jgi:hypothetical protein
VACSPCDKSRSDVGHISLLTRRPENRSQIWDRCYHPVAPFSQQHSYPTDRTLRVRLVKPVRIVHGAISSMSTRLRSLIRRIFKLLAFARPRAAGIMLSNRSESAAINGAYSPVASFA